MGTFNGLLYMVTDIQGAAMRFLNPSKLKHDNWIIKQQNLSGADLGRLFCFGCKICCIGLENYSWFHRNRDNVFHILMHKRQLIAKTALRINSQKAADNEKGDNKIKILF